MTEKSEVWNICTRCRIGFYNAVESHRETCILIVLGRHSGLSTTHFSCIVLVRASKIYVKLVCCCCCCKQVSSAMLSSPPWLKLVGWGLRKRYVPCDHSGRSDVLSISCQEYAIVLVLRGSSWVREAADTTLYEWEAKAFSMGITTIGWWYHKVHHSKLLVWKYVR